MKRKISMLIAILLCLSVFAGCDKPNWDTGLPPFEPPKSEGISSVVVSSLPEGYNYSFKGTPAKEVVDYFANLNLITDFTEDPKQYDGMTWKVSITYDNGTCETIYHFGNMFVCREGGSWYKMNYDEAAQFDSLLTDLNDRIGFEVQVNWDDFVKINGITYLGDWRTTEVSAKDIGEKIGEISCGVPKVYNVSDFEPDEGSAYICAVGTELFSIHGSHDSIAALVDGKYYLYVAQDNTPPSTGNVAVGYEEYTVMSPISSIIPPRIVLWHSDGLCRYYSSNNLGYEEGIFEISENSIVLFLSTGKELFFNIEGNTIIFDAERSTTSIIDDGTVFYKAYSDYEPDMSDFGFLYSISEGNVECGGRIGIKVTLVNRTGEIYTYEGAESHFRAKVKLFTIVDNEEYIIPFESIPDTDDMGTHTIDNNDSRSFTFYFNIPLDAPLGEYDLECKFGNSKFIFGEVFTLD